MHVWVSEGPGSERGGPRRRPRRGKIVSGASDKYILTKPLGRRPGVYHADCGGLDFAVKIHDLRYHFHRESFLRERTIRDILVREGHTHKNILIPHELVEQNSEGYIITPLVAGTLESLVVRGKKFFLPEDIAHLVTGICDALQYLYDKNILHRDVKPANVFLEINGTCSGHIGVAPSNYMAKISDFGIAFHWSLSHLEVPDTLLGTEYYLAPEQWQFSHSDHRADLYSLGVTLFRLFTGRVPFTGDVAAVAEAHLRRDIPDLARYNKKIPPLVSALVFKAMAKEPEERYQSATELKEAFLYAVQKS